MTVTKLKRLSALCLAFVLAAITLVACTSSSKTAKKKPNRGKSVVSQNQKFDAPVIKNFLDYHNFVKSQELYDDPTTIQWCTFTWGNSNAPLVTVPIAGKLTSSSVSLDPSTQARVTRGGNNTTLTYNPELPSSDAMYHGSPPPYRYGFTPGGQYVDFNQSVPTFCTTALTKFQRQGTKVDITNDTQMKGAQADAEAALAKCNATLKAKSGPSKNCKAAQDALEKGLSG